MQLFPEDPGSRYPICLSICPNLLPLLEKDELLSDIVSRRSDILSQYPFIIDLLRIEESKHHISSNLSPVHESAIKPVLNPNLDVLKVKWRFLPEFLADHKVVPTQGKEYVLVFQKPGDNTVRVRKASSGDLLALKIIAEKIDSRQVAAEGNVSLGSVDGLISRARNDGLIIGASPSLKRPSGFPRGENVGP